MTHAAVVVSPESLAAFCKRWKIRELALLGSALRDDFRADSDIDLLVTFADDAVWGLLTHIQMQQELETLFQRPLDFISRRAVVASPNWLRRNAILDTAQVLYKKDEAQHGALRGYAFGYRPCCTSNPELHRWDDERRFSQGSQDAIGGAAPTHHRG